MPTGVEDHAGFRAALDAELGQVERVGEPFEYLLSVADVPAEIAAVGGQACLVEEAAGGDQVTVEGYSDGERVEIYGVVDSVTYPGASSFLRYQYPSKLPEDVVGWMADISRRVIEHIGLTDTTFNIEYLWDRTSEQLTLIEINSCNSQSHARLFQMVDGLPNHKIMVDLALGGTVALTRGLGRYPLAAKWFPRRFTDGLVRRAPTEAGVEAVERDIPGTSVEVIVKPGDRLSNLPDQDSYSYGLANVHIGARNEDELEDKYNRCMAALAFEFA